MPYGFANTSCELDDTLSKLYGIIPQLLELAEVEKACQHLWLMKLED